MNTKRLAMLVLSVAAVLAIGLQNAAAQNSQISGKVTDADDNSPLIGVNVVISGTRTGVVTDINGNYMISAPQGASLEFSCLGYETLTVPTGKHGKIDVSLQLSSNLLDELVVVGYGVQKKSDVAGSVTSIKAEDVIAFPAATISEMLRGRSAGVQVTSSSGAPGSSSNIQIRGVRSLTAGNSPLYVIDGVPSNSTEFNMINPNDVASVEILKDAAAQAIYGARAANGVVMVMTKRGLSGKTEINFDSSVSIQTLWRNFDFYAPEEWAELRRQAVATDMGYNTPELIESIPQSMVFQDVEMMKNYQNGVWTDWEGLMIKPAVMQKYSLGFRGGNDRIKASGAIAYMKQDGMVQNSGYERGNIRLNLDYQAYKWLSLGMNISAGKTSRQSAYGSFNEFITRPPYGAAYDEDGSIREYINSSLDTNPLYNAGQYKDETKADTFRINAFAEVKPFKGFSWKLNATQYARFSENGSYKTSKYTGGGAGGKISNGRTYNWVIENIVNYAVPFRNDDHSLNFTLVQAWDKDYSTSLSGTASNVPVDDFWYNMIGDGTPVSIGRSVSESVLTSYLGRAQYNWKGRYIMNAAVRFDGSSRFGANNKWGVFPSVALAWRITEEPFMQSAKRYVSNLKLRTSWGQVGNQSGIGNYTTLGTTNSYPMQFGDEFVMGYLPGNSLPNKNLKWETTSSANVGVDFGLFKNRINGTIEGYYTRTTDLLVSRQIESVLGYTSMLDNLGETRTKGLELTLDTDIFRKKDFVWNVGLNFSLYRNRIVKIDDKTDENGNPVDDVANGWFIGQPINVYYQYKAAGIYQTEDFSYDPATDTYTLLPTVDTTGDGIADTVVEPDVKVAPGSVKLVDKNGDNKINADDRFILKRDPDFITSINTSLQFKGFDFYMDWYMVSGGVKLNQYLYSANQGGSLQGKLNGIKVNYWTPSNPSNEFPRPSFNSNAAHQNTLCYQDASYVRLRTLTLGYTLPKKALSALGVSNLRLAFTATNLLTFTDYLSYSPEYSAGGYPEPRQYVFSLSLKF